MSRLHEDDISEKGIDGSASASDSRKSSLIPALPTLPQHAPHGASHTHSPLRPSQSRQSRISDTLGREVVLEVGGLNAADLSSAAEGTGKDQNAIPLESEKIAGEAEEGVAGDGEDEAPKLSKIRIIALAVTMLLTFFMSVSTIAMSGSRPQASAMGQRGVAKQAVRFEWGCHTAHPSDRSGAEHDDTGGAMGRFCLYTSVWLVRPPLFFPLPTSSLGPYKSCKRRRTPATSSIYSPPMCTVSCRTYWRS